MPPRLIRGIVLLVLGIAVTGNEVHSALEKKEEKKEGTKYELLGRDPRGFPTAAEMLTVPPRAVLEDRTATVIIEELSRVAAVRGAQGGYSNEHWKLLEKLRGVAFSRTCTNRLRDAARQAAVPSRVPLATELARANAAFREGNEAYEAGRFADAVRVYRDALWTHPSFWDAWNNMALAELHRGNDLLATYHFQAMLASNPGYAGAAANLSVSLERLGLSGDGYETAAELAKRSRNLPFAQYNLAWFENARGDMDAARVALAAAMEGSAGYPPATWLRVLNAMESGRPLSKQDVAALPAQDRINAVAAPRTVATTVNTDAWDGNRVVTRIPKGTSLLVSGESERWIAVYWPINGVKHRLYIAKAAMVSGAETPSSAVVDPPFRLRPQPGDIERPGTSTTSVQPEAFAPFLGTWGRRWGDINAPGSIEIGGTSDNPTVKMAGGWETQTAFFENGELVFRVRGGGSNWEFEYRVRRAASGTMELSVLRIHDKATFTGQLFK